jgi:hypothetical protein
MDIDPYDDHVFWEIEEVRRNNIYRRRIKRRNIHKSKFPSLGIQYHAICKEELPEEYIKHAIDDFESGYLYYDSAKEELIGVCLWKRMKAKQPTIDLLLLCSRYSEKKLGRYMLNDLDNYAHEAKVKVISVVPAYNHLVEYYASNGYETIPESKTNPKRMKKDLILFPINRRNRKTRKRTYPRNASASQPLTAGMMPINLHLRKSQRFA